MKKSNRILIVLVILLGALLLLSSRPSSPMGDQVTVTSEIVNQDGMTYRVFKGKAQFDNHIDIEVINVTKEKLEIQKLKAEIEYYKSRK